MKTTKATSSTLLSEADRTLLRAVLGEDSKTLRGVETKLVPALTGGDAGRFDASFHPLVELIRATAPRQLPTADRWRFEDLKKRLTHLWTRQGPASETHAALWTKLDRARRYGAKFSGVSKIIQAYFEEAFTAKLAAFVRSAVEHQDGSIRFDELPKLMAGGLQQGLVPPGQLGFGTSKIGPFMHFILTRCPDLEIRTTASGLNYVVFRKLFADSKRAGRKASNQVAGDHRQTVNLLTLVRTDRPKRSESPTRETALSVSGLIDRAASLAADDRADEAMRLFEVAKIKAALELNEPALDAALAGIERMDSRAVAA